VGDQRPQVIELRPIDDTAPRPHSSSPYEDWGDRDPDAQPRGLERWLIVEDGIPVGDMSAHPHFYGPNAGSKAMNMGISIADEHRGRGIGTQAQRMLAELLHSRGIVRVEASTDISNIAEQRALAKAGFICEGTLRGAQMRGDGRHDLQLWAHLASGIAPAPGV
jgi:RimJ/RimL family protein N-acetyltransferase